MKHITFLIAALFAFCSCDDTDAFLKQQPSKIMAVTYSEVKNETIDASYIEQTTIFTGNDIDWFNPETREIKFSNIEPDSHPLPIHGKVDIKMEGETLFTIVAYVNAFVSIAYDDLILFHDIQSGKYYLYDNYPDYWAPELTQQNVEKRAAGWNKFLKQLKQEGRLK